MNPPQGVDTWFTGFSRLIDLVVALHARNELELETMNAASKACAECWAVAGVWRGLESCRDGVRTVASRLKKLLDPNGRTYHGNSINSDVIQTILTWDHRRERMGAVIMFIKNTGR